MRIKKEKLEKELKILNEKFAYGGDDQTIGEILKE